MVNSINDIGELMWMGNSVVDYAQALGVFVLSLLVLAIIKRWLIGRVEVRIAASANRYDDALLKAFQTIRPPFYLLVALYVATRWLTLEGQLESVMRIVFLVLASYQVVYALQVLLGYLIKEKLVDEEDRSSEVVSSIVSVILRVVLWSLGILFVLSNIGLDVTSLIAGLGVGGIAIALAVQNVLGDLFSSLAIYFDRPFEPGDFISTGDVSGTVKKVGIKTTRIKSLSGEEIILPNKQITDSRVSNFKRMTRRRVAFHIGVTYGTEQEKMRRIPEWIKEIVGSQEQATFSRVHFHKFEDSSLSFEVVYFVEDRAYELYMDIHQEVLLGIKEKFEQEGIAMAFPTRTVVLEKQAG